MLLKRVVKNISIELSNFFLSIQSLLSCSKQAFSQGRKKLSHTAFVALNQLYVSDYYASMTSINYYKEKYLLLAVDGSLLQLPESDLVKAHFGSWKNQTSHTMPMARASLFYDVLNNVILNSKFSPLEESENDLFRVQHKEYKEVAISKKAILLMDRGYPSYDLCKRIVHHDDKFVLRCKADFTKNVKKFVTSEKEEDLIFLTPTLWYTKKGIKKQSEFSGDVQVKIVRIVLEGGNIEYLITNLLEASKQELKELYHLRWGVETIYDYLKNTLELENVSSKKVEGILQDFYACVLTCNLIHLLIKEAEEEIKQEQTKKENKYEYQINRVTAAGIMRNQIIALLFEGKDIELKLKQIKNHIKKSKVAIVPNRKFERRRYKRSTRKFDMVKKKAL
jgi:hypothetical protein